MTALSGENWDVTDKLASAKMAGQVMESIYNQKWFLYLSHFQKLRMTTRELPKNISVSVAHKIGDADEFKHGYWSCLYRITIYISIFTKNSDYDTISKIAKDVYEVLK